MNGDALRRVIKETIAEELRVPIAYLSSSATIETLALDSLTFVEIVIAAEAKLHCSIETTMFGDITPHTRLDELIDKVAASIQSAPIAHS